MNLETPPVAQSDTTPLIVDVDGTLIRADISLESFVRVARTNLVAMLLMVTWLLRGRAFAKTLSARQDPVDPVQLPYKSEVVAHIKAAQAAGHPVILASASHWRNIHRIAKHLGLTEPVIATRGRYNVKGKTKLTEIHRRIGTDMPFDYIGDSKADFSLWRAARHGWTAGVMPSNIQVERIGTRPRSLASALLKAMRPHQWAKNALVLLPGFLGGVIFNAPIFLTLVGSAAAMSVIASAIYIINDLVDIDSDRAHRTKWKRPIAHGDLPIPHAILASIALMAIGLIAGWLIGGPKLLFWLLAYVALTSAYSFRLKSVMVIDTIVLAGLYTIRIWIGAVASGVALSNWFLLFSMFLFLSLAYLKRYIELRGATDPDRLLSGRGYVGGDMDVVMMSGISSGMMAILVLNLFANDPATKAHYAQPAMLWMLCVPLIYWLNRIWMMARRGEVEDDPVAFSVKDRRSIVTGFLMVAIFAAALYGVPHLPF